MKTNFLYRYVRPPATANTSGRLLKRAITEIEGAGAIPAFRGVL